VAKESSFPTSNSPSRRSFLAKLGLGAAVMAVASLPLFRLSQGRRDQQSAMSQEFPGEDSIFHPAQDPRHKPRG
jgi:hypothetical protein